MGCGQYTTMHLCHTTGPLIDAYPFRLASDLHCLPLREAAVQKRKQKSDQSSFHLPWIATLVLLAGFQIACN